jgi:type I restriction enzyme S subunit
LLPKWRFPEFNNTGEWSTQEFKDLIEIIEERAGSKKYTLVSVTAGEGLVSQIEKFGREIAGNAYKNYYVIRKGDFAYNKSATKKYPEGYISMLATHEKQHYLIVYLPALASPHFSRIQLKKGASFL